MISDFLWFKALYVTNIRSIKYSVGIAGRHDGDIWMHVGEGAAIPLGQLGVQGNTGVLI